ncbi:MAG: hypothetical protein IKL21_06325 [Clostridia bacterium]|nr:hypothetical protein [Clostridia bacterium]
MNIKKIISVVMIFAVISTIFVSLSAIAAENIAPNGNDSPSEAANPITGDFIFGIFVAAAVIAIVTLYLVMRRKYIH